MDLLAERQYNCPCKAVSLDCEWVFNFQRRLEYKNTALTPPLIFCLFELYFRAADPTYSTRTQQEYLEYCYGLSGGGAYASVALQVTAPGCADTLSGCWR